MAPRVSVVMLACFVGVMFVDVGGALGEAMTVQRKIMEDADLSQFYSVLERSRQAMASLEYSALTIFAPTNKAFQYKSSNFDDLALYHLCNVPQNLNQLGGSISTELGGSPPLWVTRRNYNNRQDIYVNNAKVIAHRSNYQQANANGKKQVLHIIEEVLEPIITQSDAGFYNPDAFQFLNYTESINNLDFTVRAFRNQVFYNDKTDLYKNAGRHTFFIPVDDKFMSQVRPGKIDQKVIDGHIIANHVLFTNPTPDDVKYQSMAFTDMLKVMISFKKEVEGKDVRVYVKSDTVVGDSTHQTGVVLAEIVKANIPVKNGVVHLISRPLMVVDNTVHQFLKSFENQEDGPLFRFYSAIYDAQPEFMDHLTRMKELTLLAPSNNAWRDPAVNNILRNKTKLQEILYLHLVPSRLSVERIQDMANQQQVNTMANRKSLYFNVLQHGDNKTVTVEGAGVNATVVQPDIAATNGIIHIIDRVLGVPFMTVGRKIATDPMLNDTYWLGQNLNFNDQLDDMSRRYTYFVPRDYAWKKMEVQYPSAYKKFFMRDYGYNDVYENLQVKQILERHLVIADQAYTMNELKEMSHLSGYLNLRLPTSRDVLTVSVTESSDRSFFIEWNNEKIHVFRADVECTNGIIHVIDSVFYQEGDIRVNTGAITASSFSLVCLTFSSALIRLFNSV
nr:PREDICTED: fasciclin-1 isoform X3 [Bemisia tabaci]